MQLFKPFSLTGENWRLVIVDVQWKFVKQLSTERAVTYPAQVRAFANQMWEEHRIPATIVTYLDWNSTRKSFHRCSAEIGGNRKLRQKLVARHDIAQLGIMPHEDLLGKSYANAFAVEDFAPRLKAEGVTGIIPVGMFTHMCMARTILGARDHGFRVVVPCDLLADKLEKPDAHGFRHQRKILEDGYSAARPLASMFIPFSRSIRHMESAAVLRELKL